MEDVDYPEAEQHLLVPYLLDEQVVAEDASGRTGGWVGPARARALDEARRRWRVAWPMGTTFAVLLGAILVSALTPREAWLDLAGASPVAFVVAGAAAGMLAGLFHRRCPGRAARTGATAAAIALLGVYAAVRASMPGLFADASAAGGFGDVLMLLSVALPAGAGGGVVASGPRRRRD